MRRVESVSITYDELLESERKIVSDFRRWGCDSIERSPKFHRKSDADLERSHREACRREILARSYTRMDKSSKPPVCLLCLHPSTSVCGPLRWLPKFPDFFAFHELCVLTCNNTGAPLSRPTTPLESAFFGLSVESIRADYMEIKQLVCAACKTSGAFVQCKGQRCADSFHLPCAIIEGVSCSYIETDYSILCNKHNNGEHMERKFCMLEQLVLYARNRESKLCGQIEELIMSKASMQCYFCSLGVDYDHDQDDRHMVVITTCCGFMLYHFNCMEAGLSLEQKYIREDTFNERRCPRCQLSNDMTMFPEMLCRQGIFARMQTHQLGFRGVCDSPQNTKCYGFLLPHGSRECLHPGGPWFYDLTEIFNSSKYIEWEPINECSDCSVNIHRACAGAPWSLYISGQDGGEDEPLWICQDCTISRRKAAASIVCVTVEEIDTDVDVKPELQHGSCQEADDALISGNNDQALTDGDARNCQSDQCAPAQVLIPSVKTEEPEASAAGRLKNVVDDLLQQLSGANPVSPDVQSSIQHELDRIRAVLHPSSSTSP